MKAILLMLSVCLLNTLGQILAKKGINRQKEKQNSSKGILFFFEPKIIAGSLMALVAPLFYIKAIEAAGLGQIYGLNGLNYLIVYTAGILLLKEQGSTRKTLGILLIAGGIALWSL